MKYRFFQQPKSALPLYFVFAPWIGVRVLSFVALKSSVSTQIHSSFPDLYRTVNISRFGISTSIKEFKTYQDMSAVKLLVADVILEREEWLLKRLSCPTWKKK